MNPNSNSELTTKGVVPAKSDVDSTNPIQVHYIPLILSLVTLIAWLSYLGWIGFHAVQ